MSPIVGIWQCLAAYTLLNLSLIVLIWLGHHTPSSGFAIVVLPSLFAVLAKWHPAQLSPIPLTWPSSNGGMFYHIAEVLVIARVGALVLLGGIIANHISYFAEVAWCWKSGLPAHVTGAGRLQGNSHRAILLYIYAIVIMIWPAIPDQKDSLVVIIVKMESAFAALYGFAILVMLAIFDVFPVGERRKEREREIAMVDTCGPSW